MCTFLCGAPGRPRRASGGGSRGLRRRSAAEQPTVQGSVGGNVREQSEERSRGEQRGIKSRMWGEGVRSLKASLNGDRSASSFHDTSSHLHAPANPPQLDWPWTHPPPGHQQLAWFLDPALGREATQGLQRHWGWWRRRRWRVLRLLLLLLLLLKAAVGQEAGSAAGRKGQGLVLELRKAPSLHRG